MRQGPWLDRAIFGAGSSTVAAVMAWRIGVTIDAKGAAASYRLLRRGYIGETTM